MTAPETRYARSGNVRIAYQVVGEGPLDLVFVPGFVSNIDLFWETPEWAQFFSRLAGGQEVKNLGDGFMATFDGPARAVCCAKAIAEAVRPLGLAVRSGLHTGEIELQRDDIAGIAVHIAAA